VKDGENLGTRFGDTVDNPVTSVNELANRRIPDFGYDATRFGKFTQSINR
jgi:hypothetical protein